MIHSVFHEYTSVKIGGTGQPLNCNCYCHTHSPHPVVSAVRYEVVYPLMQKPQFQMAGLSISRMGSDHCFGAFQEKEQS